MLKTAGRKSAMFAGMNWFLFSLKSVIRLRLKYFPSLNARSADLDTPFHCLQIWVRTMRRGIMGIATASLYGGALKDALDSLLQ
jgi:hypothetical protein